jgi:hypothetical protein
MITETEKMSHRMHRPEGSKGQNNSDLTTQDFYKFYMKQLKKDPTRIPRSKMRQVFNDLTKSMMAEVRDGGKIQIHKVGNMYVKLIKVPLMEEGDVNPHLPIDWKTTYEYWEALYPDLTREELKALDNKPLIRHLNSHTKQYVGKYIFARTFFLEDQSWRFEPSTRQKRALARTIKNSSNKRAFLS